MSALTTPPAQGTDRSPSTARASASRAALRATLLPHRPALYVWAALVVALAALLLWLYGPAMDAAADGWRRFHACRVENCAYDQDAILVYKDFSQYAAYAVTALPFLAAAWAGAVLTARELETGTAALAWTQSVSPTRWLAAQLAVPAALVTAGTGTLVLLHHLMWSASRGRIDTAKSWTDLATFHANGTTTVAFALFGLAAGVLAGLLLRRVLPSLAVSVLATGAVWAVISAVRPYLWPTVTHVSSLDARQGLGLPVDEGLLTSTGARLPDPHCGSSLIEQCQAQYERLDAVSWYSDSHPASHYWPLQLVATGIVLALTALSVLAAFRLLRHRTGTALGTARAGARATARATAKESAS